MTEQKDFYKIKDGKRIYYFDNISKGEFFEAKNYLIAHLHMAPTKAKKKLDKIKEWKDKDALSV